MALCYYLCFMLVVSKINVMSFAKTSLRKLFQGILFFLSYIMRYEHNSVPVGVSLFWTKQVLRVKGDPPFHSSRTQ